MRLDTDSADLREAAQAVDVAPLRAPFPWFGGKSRAAPLIWERFGNVPNYVEPFAGSLAVLLSRPHAAHTETVNDLDCYLANFWRALRADPDAVAEWCADPVNEADLHARHLWLISQADFRERMRSDPDYFDAKVAGWWVWGICAWIGSGWCAGTSVPQQLPSLSSAGMGVRRPHQKLPALGDGGRGVHRPSQQLPHLGNAGQGVRRPAQDTPAYLRALAERLGRVRVACGEWHRVLGDSVTWRHGVTGILLDPPYDLKQRARTYSVDTDVSAAVRQWAIEHGDHPKLRIALCGYEGEHEMPDTWTAVAWKARGGYGSQGNGRGRENAARERIWFSPHCLSVELAGDPLTLALA